MQELETVGQNAEPERELGTRISEVGDSAGPEVEAEAAEKDPAENIKEDPPEGINRNPEAQEEDDLAHREEVSRRNTYVEVYYLDGPHW